MKTMPPSQQIRQEISSLLSDRGPIEGILLAWGGTREGHRVLLHLMLGNKESYGNWRDLLRDMVRRGLKVPLMITSDGAPQTDSGHRGDVVQELATKVFGS